MDVNIQLINENVSNYVSNLNPNHPDFSISELKKQLKEMIGQEPAIEIKRKPKQINELVTKSGGKVNEVKEQIDEIIIYYVDVENKKPVKLRMLC